MQTLKTSKARENILSRIRKGLSSEKTNMPFPEVEKENKTIFQGSGELNEEVFAASFIQLGGKFIFCENEADFVENIVALKETRNWGKLLCGDKQMMKLIGHHHPGDILPADPFIEDAEACITGCEFLVARTGSILLSSAQNVGRTASVFYPVHIVFAYVDQVVSDIDEGLNALKKKYKNQLPSMINLNTGPSRTADIEKTLVVGVHGPAEVFCFLINGENPEYIG